MSRTYVVTHDDTALAVGSGDVPVLATPRLIAWLEAATVAACPPLDTDETTVGTRVDVEHVLASPVGARVETVADLVHRDGRLLRFTVAAHHDLGAGLAPIGRGEVTRVIVRRGAFVERAGAGSRARVIREATSQEWQAIGDLCVEAYATGYGLSPDTEDGYVDVLRDVATRARGSEVLACLEGGRLVGSVTIIPAGGAFSEIAEEGEIEFRFMAVAPGAWRSGVGRALVQAVLDRAAGAPVVCSVIEGNEPAEALYLDCGFVRDPGRDHEPVPGVRLRAYRASP